MSQNGTLNKHIIINDIFMLPIAALPLANINQLDQKQYYDFNDITANTPRFIQEINEIFTMTNPSVQFPCIL